MSLGPKGLLRWYADSCRTPIGNTPRNPKLSYVGLVHGCLVGTPAEMDAVGGSRMSGTYRQNPFFRAGTDEPIVPPHVLTAAQHQALRGAN
jgi:hypothetical protein